MSTKTPLIPLNKVKLFAEWMKGDHVLVHLDARRPDVDVPKHLKNHPALTLKLSYLFQGKTEHDDEGITAYLKFSGVYHECRLPWVSLWGMTSADGEAVVWPEDAPSELLQSSFIQEAEKQAIDDREPSAAGTRVKPNLTAVHSFRPREKPGEAGAAEEAEGDDPSSPSERRKGLTRIK